MVDLATGAPDPEPMRCCRAMAGIVLAACGGSGEPPPGDAAGAGEPAELAGITQYHNQVRMMVDTTGVAGGPLPALVWDASLAATAAAWVACCQDSDGHRLVDHNPDRSTGH